METIVRDAKKKRNNPNLTEFELFHPEPRVVARDKLREGAH